MANNNPFYKGHPNYNLPKKIKASEFAETWNKYAYGQISQVKASKELGISIPTFRKWAYEIIVHGCIDNKLSFLIWDIE